MAKDGVSLLKIGGTVVLLIEMFPTMYMLALDEEQAERLGQKMIECAKMEGSDSANTLLNSLVNKAPKGEPS